MQILNPMCKIHLFTFIIAFSIMSCNKNTGLKKTETHNKLAYNEVKPVELVKENSPQSIKENFLNNEKAKNSPIKIISSQLFKNPYSNHKDIKIVFKNASKKDIQALKLEWYCENSFNEPANGKFFYEKGKSTGNIAQKIRVGSTKTFFLEDFSTDANVIIKARAYYVIFSDGSKWNLH